MHTMVITCAEKTKYWPSYWSDRLRSDVYLMKTRKSRQTYINISKYLKNCVLRFGMDLSMIHNYSRLGVSLRYWFFHLLHGRPTLLLSVGVYSHANLGMRVTFFNKSRVHLRIQSTIILFKLYILNLDRRVPPLVEALRRKTEASGFDSR
jgi:hypothetical protein